MPNLPKHPRDGRRHKRFRTRSPIGVALLDGTPLASVEEVHDISEGGMCFSCRDFVKPNLMLLITIKDKEGAIHITGRVARVRPATFHKGQSEVGIMFMDVTEEQKKRLKKLPKKGWFG